MGIKIKTSFSPRNGEVILKVIHIKDSSFIKFQSPQWGSNSKDVEFQSNLYRSRFQSPQWGSNSKV